MSHSVRLLTRLGVAIEKIGQKISKIGGGTHTHTKPGSDICLSGAVGVVNYASKANANYPTEFKTFGDDVNKHGAFSDIVNIDLGTANAHLAGFATHLKNPPNMNQGQSFTGNNLELLNRQYSAAQLRNFPRKESSGGDK